MAKRTDWQNMIIVLSITLFVLILIVLIPYYWNFGSTSVDKSFAKWVEFSTYAYNFFILILSIINIILFAYIAKIAQSFDSKKFTRNIELQEQYNNDSRMYECKMKIASIIDDIQKAINDFNSPNLIIAQASLTDFLKIFSTTLELDSQIVKEFDIAIDNICEYIQKESSTKSIDNNLLNSFVEKKYKFINSINSINSIN